MGLQKMEATVKGDLANQINLRIIEEFEKKYNLYLLGVGLEGPVKLKTMRLILGIDKPITKEEARHLIVKCSREYLRAITSNEELQQYLEEPFTLKNINLSICGSENGKGPMAPALGDVQCLKGGIRYTYYELVGERHCPYFEDETFEEAAAIVDSEEK